MQLKKILFEQNEIRVARDNAELIPSKLILPDAVKADNRCVCNTRFE
jgi:hypothetical protein